MMPVIKPACMLNNAAVSNLSTNRFSEYTKMKVLHVIPSLDPKFGGMSQAVRTLVSGLEPKGVQNEIVTLDEPTAGYIKESAIIVHALGKGSGPWCYNKALYPWLVNNLSSYDKVVVHGLWQYPGFALSKAVKEVKVPYYVMPHGMLDPYFQRANGRRFKALRNTIYWKLIERHVINSADGLMFTCEEEKQLAHEPFKPYRPKKEIVVGMGVEEPPPKRDEMMELFYACYPELLGSKYILFLSRIHEKKGVDMLVESYREMVDQLFSKNPHVEVPKLLIAGPGLETPYGRQILRQVDSAPGLKDHIIFPGMLSGEMKWGAYYGAEAFILPSHQENFGIAVVEALACSKPVLISNQVNIYKEIVLGEAAIVADDTPQGAFKLLKYWSEMSNEKREKMKENARCVYETHFAVEPAMQRMIDALQLKDNKHGPVTA